MDKRVLRERMRKKQQQIRRRQMMKKGAYVVAVILVFIFVIRGIILPVINRAGGGNTEKPQQVQAETDSTTADSSSDSTDTGDTSTETNAAIRQPVKGQSDLTKAAQLTAGWHDDENGKWYQNADGTYDLSLKEGTYISAKGKNVMVIGGGDTGNDCVGTSMRHGAKSVLQLEMMPKAPDERTEMNPWPEWPRVCKTDYGQQEAAAVFGHDPRVYQTTVKEFKKDKNGKVCKAVLVKLEPKKDEKTGRMMMAEVAGSEYTVDVDLVLIAAGFLGSQDYVTKAFGVEVNERTNVKTAAGAYSTNVKNVFTAGDMHRGQSLVVWAIREGREAAKAVDISLMGYTNMYVQ